MKEFEEEKQLQTKNLKIKYIYCHKQHPMILVLKDELKSILSLNSIICSKCQNVEKKKFVYWCPNQIKHEKNMILCVYCASKL